MGGEDIIAEIDTIGTKLGCCNLEEAHAKVVLTIGKADAQDVGDGEVLAIGVDVTILVEDGDGVAVASFERQEAVDGTVAGVGGRVRVLGVVGILGVLGGGVGVVALGGGFGLGLVGLVAFGIGGLTFFGELGVEACLLFGELFGTFGEGLFAACLLGCGLDVGEEVEGFLLEFFADHDGWGIMRSWMAAVGTL